MRYRIESYALKNSFFHSELVDAEDEEDLKAKLLCCKDAWNEKERLFIPQDQPPKSYQFILDKVLF